jgi:hypothetical protein
MEKVNKLLYIGAGLHLDPIKTFSSTKKFIFIDTLPRSEFDSRRYYTTYYNYNFLNELINNLKNLNFVKKEEVTFKNSQLNLPYINSTLIRFYNPISEQIVNYYVSTNIVYDMNSELLQDIDSSNGLLVSSYYPDKYLLNYFGNKKKLYCYANSIFNYKKDHWFDEEYEGSIFKVIEDKNNSDKYFDEFYLINDNGIEKFDSIEKLKNANDLFTN